jgi:hypothetical protein
LLLNLQKSNWGDEFYIELGAISGELPEKLQIWHSPLRIRIGSCVTDRRVLALLDFNKTPDADEQIRQLGDALETGGACQAV